MDAAEGFGFSFLELLVGVISLYWWVILVRALLSWVNPDPYNPIVRALVAVTEPVLRPFRRLIPPRLFGGLDLSPIAVLLILEFLKNGLLYSFGYRARLLF